MGSFFDNAYAGQVPSIDAATPTSRSNNSGYDPLGWTNKKKGDYNRKPVSQMQDAKISDFTFDAMAAATAKDLRSQEQYIDEINRLKKNHELQGLYRYIQDLVNILNVRYRTDLDPTDKDNAKELKKIASERAEVKSKKELQKQNEEFESIFDQDKDYETHTLGTGEVVRVPKAPPASDAMAGHPTRDPEQSTSRSSNPNAPRPGAFGPSQVAPSNMDNEDMDYGTKNIKNAMILDIGEYPSDYGYPDSIYFPSKPSHDDKRNGFWVPIRSTLSTTDEANAIQYACRGGTNWFTSAIKGPGAFKSTGKEAVKDQKKVLDGIGLTEAKIRELISYPEAVVSNAANTTEKYKNVGLMMAYTEVLKDLDMPYATYFERATKQCLDSIKNERAAVQYAEIFMCQNYKEFVKKYPEYMYTNNPNISSKLQKANEILNSTATQWAWIYMRANESNKGANNIFTRSMM